MMSKITIVLILLLAGILRLWQLSDYPAGFNADEAALGYNAYSLLTTGRDEHGAPWPVNLESFGDFKPAGYAYLLIPFIKALDMTEFAVRLPSALFGILAVLFTYLLVKELFENLKFENCLLAKRDPQIVIENWKLKIEDIAAFMLAISPWHLHFSRGAWEVNVATTLILIGVWSFVKWQKRPKFLYLIFSTSLLVLSMYFYQSARVIAPLLGLGLAGLYRRDLLRHSKQMVINILLLLLLLLPLGISIITSDAGSRLSGVGLLADVGPLRRVEQLRGQHADWNSLSSRLLHNRPVIYTIQFMANYLDHFAGDFLFVNGDEIQRNKVPETGLFYLTDFFLLALGLAWLTRHPDRHSRVIWLWLLVAPVASAMTFQTPHALRAHSLVIPMTILISVGIVNLINSLGNWPLSPTRWPKGLLAGGLGVLILVYSWQFARYLHQYYVHYPRALPAAWEYGFKELVGYVESVKDRYQRILVTDKYDQPYILFLFYSQYPPAQFQFNHQLTVRDQFNFSTVRDYGPYHFDSTPWAKVSDIHSALIVAAPEDIPDVGVNVVTTINFPSGAPAFKIVSN